jgi:hypothetical protein
MFSIQGWLTGQSKLHDELQTAQPDRKISDLQPHKSQLEHHANCCSTWAPQIHDQP